MPEQTLYHDPVPTETHKYYVLCDDAGLFISFGTAQEAFDWIALHTPGVITHVVIRRYY